MKIVFVTPEFLTEKSFDGGLANYVNKIAGGLLEKGHTPIVMVASHKNEKIIYCGIEVHRINVIPVLQIGLKILNKAFRYSLDFLHPWYFQSYIINRYLAKYLKKNKISAVQFASYTTPSLCWKGGVPAMIRISGYQSLWEEGYGADPLSNRVMQIERLELKAFRAMKLIFSPSKLLANIVGRKLGHDIPVVRSPLSVFKGGQDLTTLQKDIQSKKYLMFFGSMGRLKGVDLIADILPDILEKHKELSFVFVGKDMKYKKGKMSDHIKNKTIGYEDRVLILGKLTHSKLMPLLKGSEAVLLPSRIDNFPNACVEAMAAGALVIGARGASFEEIITDGVNGFLFKVGDASDLLRVVENVLALHQDDISHIKKRAAHIEDASYDPSISVESHIRIYSSAIY